MTKIFMIRQGDVMVKAINAIPEGLKSVKPDNGRTILAYGEVTGHAHALPCSITKLLEDVKSGRRYLEVKEDAPLTHEEHTEIKLPAGIYEVITQREYSPAGIRNVAD